MEKIFNILSSFKAQDSSEGGVTIRGMASTIDLDRAGDSIAADAWKQGGLNNFTKNPIILFNHNYDVPIGKATGLDVTEAGLELEAKISKSAPGAVCELIKDGVLGAFSVGFRIKDADFIEETGGLRIKDAELFEVSVVSVPCNQEATFSLAKSFDSTEEYEAFKKTFTNRVDLAGQNLAKAGENSPNVASDTPDGVKETQMEINMDNSNIDLEAFAKKVAEETAAKIAIKNAEKAAQEKAAAEAEAKLVEEKAEAESKVVNIVTTGLQSGTEKLIEDINTKFAERDSNLEEVILGLRTELSEKAEEITAINNSKRVFADRGGEGVSAWGKDFLQAHMLGVVSGKGMDTDFARNVMQKAGVDYTTSAGDIDQEIASQIHKEVGHYQKVAELFQSMKVNGGATVLPIQPDVDVATWQTDVNAAAALDTLTGATNDTTYEVKQVILNAHRLYSSTYLDNDIDEQVLISILPMLTDGVARAHAKAVDKAIMLGESGKITGLEPTGVAATATNIATAATALTGLALVKARAAMGKYGLDPAEVTYIVSTARYFELLEDVDFHDINQVGALSTKVKGSVGTLFGSNVVVSEHFEAEGIDKAVAIAVNTRNYLISRLRGIRVEQDYEVGNQRRIVVASQSMGFTELVNGYTGNEPCVNIEIEA